MHAYGMLVLLDWKKGHLATVVAQVASSSRDDLGTRQLAILLLLLLGSLYNCTVWWAAHALVDVDACVFIGSKTK